MAEKKLRRVVKKARSAPDDPAGASDSIAESAPVSAGREALAASTVRLPVSTCRSTSCFVRLATGPGLTTRSGRAAPPSKLSASSGETPLLSARQLRRSRV
ncbi:MAG: hypothetical protein GY937_23975 [bacterium]|nr:hypothetical protein [bacterium]